MPSDDAMDVEAVQKALSEAVRLQMASLLEMTVLAGSLPGVLGAVVKAELRRYLVDEVEDTVFLTEKLTALGGSCPTDVPELVLEPKAEVALRGFLDRERRLLASVHAVIPHSGQEPHSEALEHRLEHVIMRKQQQVEFLTRALE
jgi:hypothetical protein